MKRLKDKSEWKKQPYFGNEHFWDFVLTPNNGYEYSDVTTCARAWIVKQGVASPEVQSETNPDIYEIYNWYSPSTDNRVEVRNKGAVLIRDINIPESGNLMHVEYTDDSNEILIFK